MKKHFSLLRHGDVIVGYVIHRNVVSTNTVFLFANPVINEGLHVTHCPDTLVIVTILRYFMISESPSPYEDFTYLRPQRVSIETLERGKMLIASGEFELL